MRNKLFIATLLISILAALLMVNSLLNIKSSISVVEAASSNNKEKINTTKAKVKRERTTEVAKENETVYDIDDNDKISWGNLCFSVENKQLFVYLNSYNNKFKTAIKNVEYMYFIHNKETKEGTIIVVTDEDINRYTFKDTDVFTKENLKDLVGTAKKITQ